MPPSGGTRTDLSLSARYTVTPSSWNDASVIFGPGQPIQPISDQPVRLIDFPTNVNTTLRPRSYEPFGFRELKAFANVELVRLAIETRKDQFERLEWQIKAKDVKAAKGVKAIENRIDAIAKFWRKPDGVTPFASWLRLSLEDLLVLDAPAFEKRRTYGGQLIGLDVVPGDTIHPMVDATGRRPRGKDDVAYQQVIKGVAWADLTNADLIYAPRNPRPNHIYGLGPVEQVIITINTIMRRQARQLAYFVEGNIPAGILNAPEGWNPDQIKQFQIWMDAKIAGSTAEQSKLLWVPSNTKYTSFKDSPLKDDFDEWLARVVAYCFSLPPTPFIKQMNRSTGQTDQDRSEEEGLEPLKLWVKRLIDGVIEDDFASDDLEFAWVDTPSIDPKIQSDIDNTNLRNGSATIDEVRDARGQDPLPGGQGAQPLLYTSTGAMTLEQVLKASEDAVNPVEAPTALPDNQTPPPGQEEPGGEVDAPLAAPRAPAEKVAKAARRISADRPLARRAAVSLKKTIAPILQATGDHVAADVVKALRGLKKAADDTGFDPAKIAAAVSLSSMDDIEDAVFDDLFEVTFDSAGLAIAQVGAKNANSLVDQVHDRAVDYARKRGGELVSIQGDDNIIASTRKAIGDVIAQGLADNIGSKAIAENLQASHAFSPERAELIAKTEISKANGSGKMLGWREAQGAGLVLEKTWQISNDDGVDEECEGNEAQGAIPLDEAFQSGDDCEPAHVNCRCDVFATVVEDNQEDGEGDEEEDE